MNALIIGGLFAVALLAVIGTVFLMRGESVQAPASSSVASTSEQEKTDTESDGGVSLKSFAAVPSSAPNADQDPRKGPSRPAPYPGSLHISLRESAGADSQDEEPMLPLANGQLHELAAELRTLHQQALDLGQRLSVLTEIADHIERGQASRVSVMEDEGH
jgi:hypothetical protein